MAHQKEFDTNRETNNQALLAENIKEQADLAANEPKRQKLKLMLIGSREAVKSGIYHFHLTGQSEISDWSPLEPNPNNREEMMSILIRHITVQ